MKKLLFSIIASTLLFGSFNAFCMENNNNAQDKKEKVEQLKEEKLSQLPLQENENDAEEAVEKGKGKAPAPCGCCLKKYGKRGTGLLGFLASAGLFGYGAKEFKAEQKVKTKIVAKTRLEKVKAYAKKYGKSAGCMISGATGMVLSALFIAKA